MRLAHAMYNFGCDVGEEAFCREGCSLYDFHLPCVGVFIYSCRCMHHPRYPAEIAAFEFFFTGNYIYTGVGD